MSKSWDPSSWVSLSPNGLGHVKPNHYLEIAKTVWKNKDQLPFAWRILSRGVCDGCALGTTGLRDFTMEGVHLCMVRLDMMRLNTMPALDVKQLADVRNLLQKSSADLRNLGRLPYPMLRRRGQAGFARITWEQALEIAASRIQAASPRRLALYLTSRGLTNETYYVAQKVARFLGTNNVDNSSRICHASSTSGLKQSLGVSASTCSYTDWIGTDLLVFFGSNTPNNQPVTTKYIYNAKKQGTKVVVINPYREPGLERYWVPSVLESALFGTKLADEFFQVNTGGDRAFIAGVIRHLIEQGWIDDDFIRSHTSGFDGMKSRLSLLSWEAIETESGATRDRMLEFARIAAAARTAVFVWSMGITQHKEGTANVRAIVNLALSRGFIGREKCGLMPIRGHSGVQGGAEVGAAPNLYPGGRPVNSAEAATLHKLWGFSPPDQPGMNAVEMIEAAGRDEIDVFYQVGGNFLETLPEPERVRNAIERIPVRIHQDIVLSSQMLVEPSDIVLLLPAQTRYEQRGGGTETSTERRILFSPEIPGRRIGDSKPEWEILMDIASQARPSEKSLIYFEDAQAIRDEIAKTVPSYAGIESLRKAGDQVQWGGTRLCEQPTDNGPAAIFPTADGLAKFTEIGLTKDSGAPGDRTFRLSTRRGKQFNSMIHRDRDPLTGARRDDVLISEADAGRLGLAPGDSMILKGAGGTMKGKCRIAAIATGNIQVHWPEGNVLIQSGSCDPDCGIPDFNATVTIETEPP
jgi:molybdopterin-dependent oxidoreductase alpha subunit